MKETYTLSYFGGEKNQNKTKENKKPKHYL